MSFALGVLLFVFGTAVVALCLAAIPGPGGGQAVKSISHDHGSAHH